MDDIAERAGVSKPVLYQHFPSKLELYCALLDQHADDLLAKVRRALDSTTDNKARVAASVAAYFDFVDGKGSDVEGAFRLVFESDLRNDPAVRERVERMTRGCADAIAETIATTPATGPRRRSCSPSG
jgi:AcrR family transcriptional regulator